MKKITETKYASWLEKVLQTILDTSPEKIGIVLLGKEYDSTLYFGDCGHVDKAIMAHEFEVDAMMDVVTANANQIAEAAQDIENEDSALGEEADQE